MKTRFLKILIVLVFVIFYFFVRYPIYKVGWDGTDGNGTDTALMVFRPPKPDYFLLGRFDGKDFFARATGHPAPAYEIYKGIGAIVNVFNPWERMDQGQIVTTAKIISSLFQLMIFLSLLVLLLNKNSLIRITGILGLLMLSVSPIAMYSANELQIDSSLGFLSIGFYELILVLAAVKKVKRRLLFFLTFISAFIIGLGKVEWSFTLGIALLISLLCYFLIGFREKLRILIFTLIGCVMGNLASYFFEPRMYLSGWGLMLGMAGRESILNPVMLWKVINMNIVRLPYITIIFVLFLYVFLSIIKNKFKVNFYLLIGMIYSLLLFFSFFSSTWGEVPRYFAPAFAGILVISVGFHLVNKRILWFIGILLAANILIYKYDNWLVGKSIYGRRDINKILPKMQNCVPLLRMEDMYLTKYDYVHLHMGPEGGMSLAKDNGKILCNNKWD